MGRLLKHTICHIEIPAKDLERAAAFYARAFGWQIEFDVGVGAASFETGKAPGGFISNKKADLSSVVAYILTDDIEAELEKIVRLGGAKVSDRMLLGEDDSKGWVALFRDPEGNILGLRQRKQ
jgi:hypothetical protein